MKRKPIWIILGLILILALITGMPVSAEEPVTDNVTDTSPEDLVNVVGAGTSPYTQADQPVKPVIDVPLDKLVTVIGASRIPLELYLPDAD